MNEGKNISWRSNQEKLEQFKGEIDHDLTEPMNFDPNDDEKMTYSSFNPNSNSDRTHHNGFQYGIPPREMKGEKKIVIDININDNGDKMEPPNKFTSYIKNFYKDSKKVDKFDE